MHANVVARNYAETLLTLAQRHGGLPTVQEFARGMDQLNTLLQNEPRVRTFLDTPRVDVEAKQRAVRTALQGRVPELFLRFVLVVIAKRRAPLLSQIASAYHDRVDELLGRVRADITLAYEPDENLRREIVGTLEQRLGQTVVPTFTVDPLLIGGVIVRVGDQILDGSVRHRLDALRRRLLQARLPQPQKAMAASGNFE